LSPSVLSGKQRAQIDRDYPLPPGWLDRPTEAARPAGS
jgi:hypothetical protein